jgi:hypothetical protein
MEKANERREYLRADLNIFVNEESRTARLLAKAVDISERGVQYVAPLGSANRDTKEVALEFSLPGEELPLRALGRVVYDTRDAHKQRTAIEFTMIRSADAERIRQYVGRRKRAELFEQMRTQHLVH